MSELNVKRWTEMRPPTPALLVLRLGGEGYQIKHWIGKSGQVYAWRRLERDRVHWVVSGELEIINKTGAAYRLKAGDRDFIPAESWYMARVVGDASVDYLVGEKIIEEKPKRKRGRPKKI